MKGILGRKVGMTQIFTETGALVPVTVVEVQPNKVLQVKTADKDGYQALQLGVQDKRANLVNKPGTGHFKKAGSNPKRYVKEIRGMEGFEQGADITASDLFNAGQFVDVTGISKGKGFAGSIKRHNYHTGPMAHGSGYHRGVGSMGAIINRIFKSKKMPGHMGHEKVTIQNLELVTIDANNNLMFIKGSIPGPKNAFVQIRENVKGKNPTEAATILTRNAKPTTEAAPVAEEQA
ncbi:50S ribosomal protein L3 [Mesoplasma lactucae]|uniref:Large ribosomal subunit protein uL3 n=1 Tax=Mesoplasma lactucae ATCC 49193 TaxID=81460 RepID=A0A291IQZ6_9MOLU|nr:50S ribosomal protein L3 [Mesoplasma lactucae]ATG97170.1 50S ribosomal protein L3 [Mesoplasma lactucae ATCC 49193]ATZ20390.1 50S ribosomal protein L3 [Mesoplasma lactucae ATCC 49193]MCL8216561.1 50S ribosomal protein L3 [Mesoplasma lactucae ATCC 49193]